jgi:predicted phage terminase large subunit-like protein
MLSDAELFELERLIEIERKEAAKANLLSFTKYTFQKFQNTWFHENYYRILDLFAKGQIKKLIISVPPQHGKSQNSSIQLPAFMIGRDPELKIATVCYSATKARKFGRKTKQLMTERTYQDCFKSRLAGMSDSNYINTAEEMEIVGADGSLKCVGYEGGLTGDPVDVLIMDDLYKNWQEANSPIIRENVRDWYISVADTRLHNDSQQLIVFTRWNNEDLIGFIESSEEVVLIQNWSDVETPDPNKWYKINFEAIKTGDPTEIDPRQKGEALWPERHGIEKLLKSRAMDPLKFECLFQGNPTSAAGLLYGSDWKTYQVLPPAIIRKNYTDTADTGTDYLCSIDYDVCADGLAYVVDVRYTSEPMEVTEPLVAGGLLKNKVHYADIESNNGGRGFARKIQDMVYGKVSINWFHQSNNKESRIVSQAATVKQRIVFPDDWHVRWPDFYNHLTGFKRKFSANTHDDAPDAITGIIERMNFETGVDVTVSWDDL